MFYQGQAFATEFKAPGKNLGPKQVEIKAKIEATGCPYLLIRSLEDFVEALNLPVKGFF